jgi:hypothetical protein
MTTFRADVWIHLLPSEAGGRTFPLNLGNDRLGQYRPHLRVINGSGEMLGVTFMDGPDYLIHPGESTRATVKALYEPIVSYDELVQGSRFEILEGPNVIGYGEVLRRSNNAPS